MTLALHCNWSLVDWFGLGRLTMEQLPFLIDSSFDSVRLPSVLVSNLGFSSCV
jgi:hypothetical protein